jgi:hypothetical protein
MRNPHQPVAAFIVIAVALISCVPYVKYVPDPIRDIGQWVKNFDRQKSFSYDYRMKTRTTDISAHGECRIGQGEHIRGRWQSAASSFDFEYYGIIDIEYSQKEGVWIIAARGEEANVFVQIQRMLSFDKFEYLAAEPAYEYRFKANVPFLAPDKWKEMVGTLRIAPGNYLPEFIWAGLPDSSVFWQVRITADNKIDRITAPVNAWTAYQLNADSMLDLKKITPAVKRRLDLIGVPYRLKIGNKALILSLPVGYRDSDVQDMLVPGQAAIYWLTGEKEKAVKIGYLLDDPKFPLLMTGEAIGPEIITDCRLSWDRASRPYLRLSLKRKLNRTGTLCLEVDHLIFAQMTIDKGQNMSTIKTDIDMGYNQMILIRAAVLQPLPPIQIIPAPGE